jgi:hypothetical protein
MNHGCCLPMLSRLIVEGHAVQQLVTSTVASFDNQCVQGVVEMAIPQLALHSLVLLQFARVRAHWAALLLCLHVTKQSSQNPKMQVAW